MSNMQKILICGANGFIGSHLVKELKKQKKDFIVFKGDILDKESIKPELDNIDTVINLVGSFSKNVFQINFIGAVNLLECCKDAGIKKIIFASSGLVYGENKGKAFKETDKPKPMSDYALSKYLAEKAHQFYTQKYQIPSVILRFSSVFGPCRKGVIPIFISRILENKSITIFGNEQKPKRDFIYVRDVVTALIKALDYQPKGFEIFNITGIRPYSLSEVIDVIEKQLDKKVEIGFGPPDKEVQYLHLDGAKAKQLLNFQSQTGLDQGINEMLSLSK
jgi:UDP-glucose 4-epimerase